MNRQATRFGEPLFKGTNEARERLAKEGRCFACGSLDHAYRQCPSRKKGQGWLAHTAFASPQNDEDTRSPHEYKEAGAPPTEATDTRGPHEYKEAGTSSAQMSIDDQNPEYIGATTALSSHKGGAGAYHRRMIRRIEERRGTTLGGAITEEDTRRSDESKEAEAQPMKSHTQGPHAHQEAGANTIQVDTRLPDEYKETGTRQVHFQEGGTSHTDTHDLHEYRGTRMSKDNQEGANQSSEDDTRSANKSKEYAAATAFLQLHWGEGPKKNTRSANESK
jgi:hypothetical protein